MKIYLLVTGRHDSMDCSDVIFKKRLDLGKVYVFLPKRGQMLEFKSGDAAGLYQLLELMKVSSTKELELLSDVNDRRQLKGVASEALDIYCDLKELHITFRESLEGTNVIKSYIKKRGLCTGVLN